jgi:(E)-4-hydroxy-3-methylbut-2-enyl-diphosphate synthase
VSLTGDPEPEAVAGIDILRSLGLRAFVDIISCPSCGRTVIDVEGIAARVGEATRHIRRDIKVAIIGCVVNGPGEAKEADIGIAGGKDGGVLFIKDKAPCPVRGDLAQILIDAILSMVAS